MKTLGVIFLVLIVIFSLGFVGALVGVISLPGHAASNAVDSAHGIIDKTINADNILSNYEQFHDMYNGAKQQAADIKLGQKHLQSIKDMYGTDATKYPKDVRQDIEFTQQTIDGQIMQYQRIVSDYNSNSHKQNRNLFKAKSLPYELPLDYNSLE